METLLSDIRYALRTIRRSPGVIAVAVFSLGLGIGANTTVFSALDVFMLRPLPYPDAHRLVHVYSTVPERGWNYNSVSIPDFLDLRDQSATVDLAASYGRGFNMSGPGERPERIDGERASWNYFRVLGIQPVLGRTFTPDEEREGRHYAAILSNELWQRRFGADPAILGRSLELDGETYTIVGVLPPKFRFSERRTDIWTPIPLTGEESRGSHFLSPVGRLEPGATLQQASIEMAAIAGRLAQQYPESNEGWGAGARDLHREIFSEEFRMGTLISSVACAFVLLIACANVANLMLTRVAGRGREIAVRGALGAARVRIVRQLLTEAMIVSFMGGALGVVLSVAGIRGLLSVMPAWFPRIDEIGLDGRVLLFAVAITLVTGVLFGIAPALHSSHPNITDALKEGGRGHVGTEGNRLRKGLVVAEVALSLALLVASALLVRGFLRLQTADFGWDSDNVLTFEIALPTTAYADDATVAGFYRDLLPRLSAIPGVESVGGTNIPPMQGNSNTFFQVVGRETDDLERRPLTEIRYVFPDYFPAMRTAVLSGRNLGDEDRPDTRRVVLINESLAERYFQNENPLGKQIEFWDGPREIVGVVRNTLDVDQYPRPMSFVSAFQNPRRNMSLVVRTTGDPTAVTEAARTEVLGVDPRVPIYQVRTLQAHIDEQQGGNTIMVKIMGVVAVIALLLAVIGVYGVMSYAVSQRTQEVGIRMALGAQRGNVLQLILRQGTFLALTGVVIGIGIAALVSRSLSLFLFGVNPFDPATFGVVSVTLLGAGMAATYLPALRATKIDPLDALRNE